MNIRLLTGFTGRESFLYLMCQVLTLARQAMNRTQKVPSITHLFLWRKADGESKQINNSDVFTEWSVLQRKQADWLNRKWLEASSDEVAAEGSLTRESMPWNTWGRAFQEEGKAITDSWGCDKLGLSMEPGESKKEAAKHSREWSVIRWRGTQQPVLWPDII